MNVIRMIINNKTIATGYWRSYEYITYMNFSFIRYDIHPTKGEVYWQHLHKDNISDFTLEQTYQKLLRNKKLNRLQ